VITRADRIQDLAARIGAVSLSHPVRVAIDGVSAAGKTTLAGQLQQALEAQGHTVIRASIDGFHNPAAMRYRRGKLAPDGYYHDSFNHAAVRDELLRPLGPDGSRNFRRATFDFKTDARVEAPIEHAEPHAILLFDGVFLLRPELRELFDFSIFVRAGFEITLARAEKRDLEYLGGVEEVRRKYRERYIPGERMYLAEVDPEQHATVIFDNDE
jgi:uridine kinase